MCNRLREELAERQILKDTTKQVNIRQKQPAHLRDIHAEPHGQQIQAKRGDAENDKFKKFLRNPGQAVRLALEHPDPIGHIGEQHCRHPRENRGKTPAESEIRTGKIDGIIDDRGQDTENQIENR